MGTQLHAVRRVAATLAVALLLTAGGVSAEAAPAPPAPAGDDLAVVTLGYSDGTEVVATPGQLLLLARGAVLGRVTPGLVDTDAVGRREGNIIITYNIYFNQKETAKIAAMGAVAGAMAKVLTWVGGTSIPAAVAVALLTVTSATLILWAGTAVALGVCVGIKTPMVGVRIPLPIYHHSGFCT